MAVPDGHSRQAANGERAARVACTLGLLLLPGCLTNWLWSWTDPDPVPTLHRDDSVLQIDGVRPGRDDTGDTKVVELAVHGVRLPGVSAPPAHLRRYSATSPGHLRLSRPETDPLGATLDDDLPADGWMLRVFGGEHMRSGTHVARVTWVGTASPDALGRRLPTPETPPPAWTGPPRTVDSALLATSRALRGFDTVDWRALLTPGRPRNDRPPVPLEWRDAAGEPLEDEAVESALQNANRDAEHAAAAAGIRLIARLDDPVDGPCWFEVPLPILVEAEDLSLRRHGDEIQFLRHERWDGDFVADADPIQGPPLPGSAFDLPLLSSTAVYSWSTEGPRTPSPAVTGIQYALTPLTALLDFLIMTTPPLARLAQWLSDDDEETRRWLEREMARRRAR